MKKIIFSVIFSLCLLVNTNVYSHYHHSSHHSYHHTTHHNTYHHSSSHTSHPTYHPHSGVSKNYYSTSHGTNGYSKPRTSYYSSPMNYFGTTHPYYHYYHHYHVGTQQDTVFCANEKHDEPVVGEEGESTGAKIFFICIIALVVGGFIYLVSVTAKEVF